MTCQFMKSRRLRLSQKMPSISKKISGATTAPSSWSMATLAPQWTSLCYLKVTFRTASMRMLLVISNYTKLTSRLQGQFMIEHVNSTSKSLESLMLKHGPSKTTMRSLSKFTDLGTRTASISISTIKESSLKLFGEVKCLLTRLVSQEVGLNIERFT